MKKICVALLCLNHLIMYSSEVMENEHMYSMGRQDFSSLIIKSTQLKSWRLAGIRNTVNLFLRSVFVALIFFADVL